VYSEFGICHIILEIAHSATLYYAVNYQIFSLVKNCEPMH